MDQYWTFGATMTDCCAKKTVSALFFTAGWPRLRDFWNSCWLIILFTMTCFIFCWISSLTFSLFLFALNERREEEKEHNGNSAVSVSYCFVASTGCLEPPFSSHPSWTCSSRLQPGSTMAVSCLFASCRAWWRYSRRKHSLHLRLPHELILLCSDSTLFTEKKPKLFISPQKKLFSDDYVIKTNLPPVTFWHVWPTGCDLPSMPWDVGQVGATSGTESTCYNLILRWEPHLFPLLKDLHWQQHKHCLHFVLVWSLIGHRNLCSFASIQMIKITIFRYENDTMTTDASKPPWHCL